MVLFHVLDITLEISVSPIKMCDHVFVICVCRFSRSCSLRPNKWDGR